jgi:ribose 1,5-bisphosphokinase PhnN
MVSLQRALAATLTPLRPVDRAVGCVRKGPRSETAACDIHPGSWDVSVSGTFVYIIGVPGSGKSTLMAELTKGHTVMEFSKPIAHRWIGDGLAMELGRKRDSFSGTDALALNVQPEAMRFVEQHPARLILAEGDRLANDKFFQKIVDSGYDFQLVWVNVRPEVAEERRALRGSNQNATWLKGRQSKVFGLTERWTVWHINGEIPASAQVDSLRANIPALAVL